MDFYFWGKIKELVYRDRPKTLNDLVNRIRAVIQSVNRGELANVMEELRRRIDRCILIDGGHVEIRR